MNIFRLLQLHLELNCLTFDHRGDFFFLPCPDPDYKPRLYIAHHPDGFITLFHHHIPAPLRAEINALTPETIFDDPTLAQEILARDEPGNTIWRNNSYLFQQRITPADYPDVTRVAYANTLFADSSNITDQPTFAIVRDGEVVSACDSARETKHAAQAFVRTNDDFQHRGYARQTLFAWAHDIQSRKKIPLYTCQAQDKPARSLAESMQLGHWLTDIAFS